MPKLNLYKRIFIFAGVAAAIIATRHAFLASDPCASISDLDDRAKCYEERINKKEDQYQSTSKKLDDVRNQKNQITSKINSLASQLSVTQGDLDDVQKDIDKVENELEGINKNLDDRHSKLSEKISLRNQVVRNYSKRTMLSDTELFFGTDVTKNGFEYAYLAQALNKSVSNAAIKLIQLLNDEISGFEKDKAEAISIKEDLTSEQNKLIALKKDLDNKKKTAQAQAQDLSKQESTYQNTLQNLSKEISELSQKQQAILNEKNGDSNGTVGNYTPPSAKTPDPPFKPAFAVFSYGAYTHYNGMSQYGAKGRASKGQNYKDILKFYYKTSVTEVSDANKLCVQGVSNSMNFQTYLYGIAEMPSDWPAEALKAQAVAARSYAYRYKKQGKCICTTESCQVFNSSKSKNPPAAWKKAVDDTEGEILSGSVVAYFSSTTGGYINNIGWDTKGSWPGDAYEKIAGSPWFYKAWYTKGYSGTDNCGRSHPWLTEKEMADILNAWVVWRKGTSSDKNHLSPVTTKCWGGDPYSLDEMANRADDLGEKYTSVKSVDVDISNNGYTSKVTLNTNRGSISMSGDVFKTVFNLRAPGYVSVKSRLFDLEKRE